MLLRSPSLTAAGSLTGPSGSSVTGRLGLIAALGAGVRQAEGVGAGFDDVATERESVDDGLGYLDFHCWICRVIRWFLSWTLSSTGQATPTSGRQLPWRLPGVAGVLVDAQVCRLESLREWSAYC